MTWRWFGGVVALLALLGGLPVAGGLAQDEATPASQLDLAAMTLDSSELPADFALSAERYYGPDQFVAVYTADVISEEELTATEFGRFYESRYVSLDGQGQIRSYISAYESAEGAEQGFALLEDEARLAPEGELTDSTEIEVGEEPREVTAGTYAAVADEGTALQTVDITFRVGTVIAGVAVETTGEAAPDQALAEDLAAEFAERIQTVLDGEAPEGLILDLSAAVLPVAGSATPLQEGYLTPGEVEALFGAPTTILPELESSYIEVAGLGAAEGDQAPTPYVAAGVSSFTEAEDTLAALEDAADLQPPFPQRESVEDVEVPGAESAIAYRFASPAGAGESVDSFRVIFIIGDQMATIDVQAAASAEAAETAALDLAAQQATCLTGDAPCEAVTIPEGL